jgi:hypothetical protein
MAKLSRSIIVGQIAKDGQTASVMKTSGEKEKIS